MMKFNKGDRVRFIDPWPGTEHMVGQVGVVREFHEGILVDCYDVLFGGAVYLVTEPRLEAYRRPCPMEVIQ